MSYTSSFTFHRTEGHLNDDACFQDQRAAQNRESCNYMTRNFFADDCAMKRPIELASTQPGIFYSGAMGGHQMGAGGCNVDDNSKLLIGTISTHPKCHISLFPRMYLTIPNLSKGSVNPVVESQLMQGIQSTNKRSVNGMGETRSYRPMPLQPQTKEHLENRALQMSDVYPTWQRGGADSRDIARDKYTNVQFSPGFGNGGY